MTECQEHNDNPCMSSSTRQEGLLQGKKTLESNKALEARVAKLEAKTQLNYKQKDQS